MSSNGLIIEGATGAGRVDEFNVRKKVVPMYQSATYHPVQNAELLDMLQKVAAEHRVMLVEGSFGVARSGQRMFGTYKVKGFDFMGKAVELILGIRNSFDKSLAVGICFGSKVTVCSNMIFTGYAGEDGISGKTSHMHTSGVEDGLYNRLNESFLQIDKFVNFQEKFYNRLQDNKVSQNDGYEFIYKSVRAGLVPKKDMSEVCYEWDLQGRGPQSEAEQLKWHPEFAERNAWSLHNAYTEYFKSRFDRNLVEANNESIQLQQFFVNSFVSNN